MTFSRQPFRLTGLRTWFSTAHSPAEQVARIASSLVFLMGCLVLMGWKLDITVLKSVLPGLATMKVNTALCFILAGVSLGLNAQPQSIPNATRLARGCAIAISTIGLLTLSQYCFGWDLGIDQLLMQDDPISPATIYPGRMGNNTALNFVLTGVALWLSGRRIRYGTVIAQTVTICAIAISLLALLGYAYRVDVFYRFIFYSTSMAVHTAASFVILGSGILALRSQRGLMKPLTQQTLGSLIAQRFMALAIVIPSILGWVVLLGLRANLYNGAFGLALLVVALISVLMMFIWQMTQDLNQLERDRNQSMNRWQSREAQLQGLSANIPGVIYQYVMHPNGTDELTYISSRSYEIYEYEPEALMQDMSLIWRMIHPDDVDRVTAINTASAQQLKPFNAEFRLVLPSRTIRWVQATSRPQRQTNGDTVWDGIVIDISDRKKTEAVLAIQTEELIRTHHLKDEFLAALSHELRTPLSPILGWTMLMRSQRLSAAKTAEVLGTIENNVRHQIRIINDLLDVSQGIQGKLKLEFRRIDLAIVLQDAVDTIQFAAQGKTITLTVQGLTSLVFVADRDRLQQVFWNLLSNSIKFTPDDGQVEVELSTIGDHKHYAQVRITDTGIGIEPDFLPHVFDRFRQADGSSTRKYGGLGLGLSIAAQLVELHGGQIRVESPGVGQGTTFTVTLPIQAEIEVDEVEPTTSLNAAESISADPFEAAVSSTLAGARILLVDDDPDNLNLLRFLLEQDGVIVTALRSAASAINLIRRQSFDLIISDIGMPELDGYELIRQVRAIPQGQFIPALALTAFAYEEDQKKAIDAGYQTYITKPVNPIELLSAIAQLLDQ